MQLLAEGKIDAFLGLRLIHRISRAQDRPRGSYSAIDRPWSQYFCCMLVGNREFVRKHRGGQAGDASHRKSAGSLPSSRPESVSKAAIDKGGQKTTATRSRLSRHPYGRWRGVQRGGHSSILRFAPARAGLIKSARRDHRRRAPLGGLERVEKGTEGMSGGANYARGRRLGLAGAMPRSPRKRRRKQGASESIERLPSASRRFSLPAKACCRPKLLEISYEYRDGSTGASLSVDVAAISACPHFHCD